MTSLKETAPHIKTRTYIPRGRNVLHTIFEKHFSDFCDVYEEQYAEKYGKFHLDRIMDVGEHFLSCGNYLNGIARICCTNPECGHNYFRPFSCKGFYLCPSCSQKRTILMAEHLTKDVLLKLPHRQIIFTFPKALRIFFRNNRKLFADFSRLIFTIIKEFYREAAGNEIITGMVIAHQTFGDILRWNPHFHSIILEAFSIDNSIQILTNKARINLTEYISRAPVSLKKLHFIKRMSFSGLLSGTFITRSIFPV